MYKLHHLIISIPNPQAYLLWRGEFCFQYNPLTLHLWRGEAFNKNTSIYYHAVQNAQIASFNYQYSKSIHVNPHAYLLWRGEFCFQNNPLTLHLWRGEAFNKNTSIHIIMLFKMHKLHYQYSKSILVNPHAYLLWRGEFCLI